MPLGTGAEYRGTETDGSPASEYCLFCYKDGNFTNPDQTVDEMVQSSIDFMTGNLGFSREEAAKRSNEVIPGLKCWT
jgi:hypothetical protein